MFFEEMDGSSKKSVVLRRRRVVFEVEKGVLQRKRGCSGEFGEEGFFEEERGSSIFESEDRRASLIFVLRVRRSKNPLWNPSNLPPIFPEHALHEKGLLGQNGDGPLVSSQERRALAVSLISRG